MCLINQDTHVLHTFYWLQPPPQVIVVPQPARETAEQLPPPPPTLPPPPPADADGTGPDMLLVKVTQRKKRLSVTDDQQGVPNIYVF